MCFPVQRGMLKAFLSGSMLSDILMGGIIQRVTQSVIHRSITWCWLVLCQFDTQGRVTWKKGTSSKKISL